MNLIFKRFYASVDISKVDRLRLLHGLWKNAKPAEFYILTGVKPPGKFSKQKALLALNAGHRIDYHQGRAIKINIHKDVIDNSYYVKYWGETAFEKALKFAKKSSIR